MKRKLIFFVKWKLNIFAKLVLTLAFVITPLFVVSLKMNGLGEQSVKSEISKSLMANMEIYINNLEMDISKIIQIMPEYVNDDDLLKLSLTGLDINNFDRTIAINNLQKKMTLLKGSSIYIKDVNIYLPLIGRTLSTNRVIDSIDQNEYEALYSYSQKPGSPIFQWNERLFLTMAYPTPPLPGRNGPMFLISVELSKPIIEKTLQQFSDYEGSGALLLSGECAVYSAKHHSIIADILHLDLNAISDSVNILKVGNSRYWLAKKSSSVLKTVLIAFVPENQLIGPLTTYRTWFWILSIIAVIVVLLISYSIYRLIHKPLNKLVRAFRYLENGVFDHPVKYYGKDEFQYLFFQYNSTIKKLKILIEEVYEHKIHAQRSELKQLQAQINPHFLYNSFFILEELVGIEDYGTLNRLTHHLGDYFQFLARAEQDEVPLELEVRHARAYAEIQTVRFSERIRIEFNELSELYRSLRVPRLIIQPLIENAFEHGLEDKSDNGLLKVMFMADEERLCISIEDNGKGLDEDELLRINRLLSGDRNEDQVMQSTGLVNIHRRLRLKYGAHSGLFVERGSSGGFKVTIQVPLGEGA